MTTVPLTFDDLVGESDICPEYWFQQDNLVLDSEGDYGILYEAVDEGHAKALLRLAQMWRWLQENPDVMQATEDVLSGVASPEVKEWAEYMYMRRNKGDWMLPIGEEEITERDRQIRHTPRMVQRLCFGYKVSVSHLQEALARNDRTLAELKILQRRVFADWKRSGQNKQSDLFQYWKHLLRTQDVLEGKEVDDQA